jgi:hypothetical protein
VFFSCHLWENGCGVVWTPLLKFLSAAKMLEQRQVIGGLGSFSGFDVRLRDAVVSESRRGFAPAESSRGISGGSSSELPSGMLAGRQRESVSTLSSAVAALGRNQFNRKLNVSGEFRENWQLPAVSLRGAQGHRGRVCLVLGHPNIGCFRI